MKQKDTLTSTQVSQSEGLEDWRVLLQLAALVVQDGLHGEGP